MTQSEMFVGGPLNVISKIRHDGLSRRERQIMDLLYRLRRATAKEVHANLKNNLHYSTVRAQLSTLERKGQVRHSKKKLCYLYEPAISPGVARRAALRHLIDTFFNGSMEEFMLVLLSDDWKK